MACATVAERSSQQIVRSVTVENRRYHQIAPSIRSCFCVAGEIA